MPTGSLRPPENTGKPMGSFEAPVVVTYSDWKQLFGHRPDLISLYSLVVHDVFIGDWLSPLEFHVVFLKFRDQLQKLNSKLDGFYRYVQQKVDAKMYEEGAACCVRTRDREYRRAVMLLSPSDECHVRLVDSGECMFVKIENVRQLLEDFSELPPLAVRCQMEGVHRDLLSRDILDEFRRKCKPGKQFNLSIVRQSKDRLIVRLLDLQLNDLFDMHFGPLLLKGEVAKRQRELAAAKGLCRKQPGRRNDSVGEDDFLFDDEDEMMVVYSED